MSVLTLSDAKNHLNITVATYDAELQITINAAEASIVRKCGPLIATAVTYRARGGKTSLLLPTTPVISLTTVTPVNGTALDITKLYAAPSGAVEYLTGGSFATCFFDVVYSAGRTVTPDDLLQAVREHVRHLWDAQRGSARRPGTETMQPTPGAAYAFTWKVNELMAPHVQPGIG